jgi:superoxide dismutase, Fe-Mn family
VSKYVLPELPYDYAALEPHISGKIMELHHDKHHRSYVDGANEAVEKLRATRRSDDFSSIAALERQIAFNVSGHILHSIFWRNLSPDGGGEPTGELAEAIRRDFGSFALMKAQLNKAAETTMGSGWAALIWEPVLQRLGTTQIHDHQSDVTQGSIPLLVIDAWEHAYYLQYQNKKTDFFEAVWNLWNWDDIAARMQKAKRVDMDLGERVAAGKFTEAEPAQPH